MNINDRTIHERKVFAHFDESDLYALLLQKVAADTGFPIDPRRTKIHVVVAKKDRAGTAGFESYAEVTLTNELPPSAK